MEMISGRNSLGGSCVSWIKASKSSQPRGLALPPKRGYEHRDVVQMWLPLWKPLLGNEGLSLPGGCRARPQRCVVQEAGPGPSSWLKVLTGRRGMQRAEWLQDRRGLSYSVLSDSLQAHGQRNLAGCRPWDFPGRIPEWVAISPVRGSSQPRDQAHVPCFGNQIPLPLSHLGSLYWAHTPSVPSP